MGDGILSLSWNNHHATFCDILKKLRKRERYTDVTLSCEGKFYPLHKFVLSTCSEFFERVFENTPCKHPVIVLSDVKCRELEALLSYMYAGAVNVPQSNLALLIKAAEILQVKGLAVPDTPPASASKQQTSSADCVSDRVSPSPKRRRTEETMVDIRTTPQETTSSDVRTKDKGRQIVPENTEVTIKQEKLSEPVSTVESSLNIVDVYHDADIKEEVVEDIIDDSENELRQLESIDYDAQLAPFKADNSNTGTSNYTEPQFDPGLQIENDVSSGTSEILEWQDGIVEADMSSHEGSSGVGMLQPSSPMLGQQSSHLAQHAVNSTSNLTEQRTGIRLATASKNYKCSHCPYSFPTPSLLRTHIRTHTGEKPFSCNFCSYRSARKYDLKNHMWIHKEERPYNCSFCNFKTVRKEKLLRHSRRHASEKN